jgi:homoserine O-acetyltransferase
MTKIFTATNRFALESGESIATLQLAYTLHGELTPSSKIVWVFHALTASSDPTQWWDGLIGTDKCFDPQHYTIICVNLPGSCYGSTGPLSIDADTNQPYYQNFPVFSTSDIINSFKLLKDYLNIDKIHIGIGASMGGQHLLQWAVDEPNTFEYIIPIACNAKQSAWSLAIDAAQRLAIEADASFKEKNEKAGINGMKAARALALVHYRTYTSFEEKQKSPDHNAESYQRYQSNKLAERFNAFSYYTLSLTRTTYNLSKNYKSIGRALSRISAKTLIIGIESDGLFPLHEQQTLADNIKEAQLSVIHSIYGHDAFLVEYEQISKAIRHFLNDGV